MNPLALPSRIPGRILRDAAAQDLVEIPTSPREPAREAPDVKPTVSAWHEPVPKPESPCGSCDHPRAGHGTRYSTQLGHHLWMPVDGWSRQVLQDRDFPDEETPDDQ